MDNHPDDIDLQNDDQVLEPSVCVACTRPFEHRRKTSVLNLRNAEQFINEQIASKSFPPHAHHALDEICASCMRTYTRRPYVTHTRSPRQSNTTPSQQSNATLSQQSEATSSQESQEPMSQGNEPQSSCKSRNHNHNITF